VAAVQRRSLNTSLPFSSIYLLRLRLTRDVDERRERERRVVPSGEVA
jgi:hypothetical protein